MAFLYEHDAELVKKSIEFSSYTSGYRRTCILAAAERIGLFRQLAKKPKSSLHEIATTLEVDEKGLSLLVDCLASMEFVSLDINGVSFNPYWADLLTEGSSMSINNELQSANLIINEWLQIPEILKGSRQASEAYSQSLFQGQCHQYLALQAYNRIQASPIIERVLPILESSYEILDLAGADGYIANEILNNTKNPTITIVDLEKSNQKCSEIFEKHVRSERLQLITQDIRYLDLNRTFDTVILTEVTELFNYDDKKTVILNAMAHLKSGGTMIITKLSLSSHEKNEGSAMFSLKMYLKAKGSYLETDDELSTLLHHTGLIFETFTSQDKTVFICRKAT